MLADTFCLVGPWTIFGLNQDRLEFWDVRDVGNLVFAEIRRGDLAVIADQLFHKARADSHHGSAVDLTLVSDGIYDGGDVVSRDGPREASPLCLGVDLLRGPGRRGGGRPRDKAVKLHVARLGVDLHLGDLGNVGGRGAFARDLEFYARRDWVTSGGDNFGQGQKFARVVAIREATGFIDNFLFCALEHLRGLRGQFSPQLAACFDHCVPTDIGRTAPAEAYVDVIGDLGCVTVAAAYLIVRHLHLGGHRLTHDRPEPGSLVAAHSENREGSIEFRGHEDPPFAGSGGAFIHGDAAAVVRGLRFLPTGGLERALERFTGFDPAHFSA